MQFQPLSSIRGIHSRHPFAIITVSGSTFSHITSRPCAVLQCVHPLHTSAPLPLHARFCSTFGTCHLTRPHYATSLPHSTSLPVSISAPHCRLHRTAVTRPAYILRTALLVWLQSAVAARFHQHCTKPKDRPLLEAQQLHEYTATVSHVTKSPLPFPSLQFTINYHVNASA